jgi:hypothetical protein
MQNSLKRNEKFVQNLCQTIVRREYCWGELGNRFKDNTEMLKQCGRKVLTRFSWLKGGGAVVDSFRF